MTKDLIPGTVDVNVDLDKSSSRRMPGIPAYVRKRKHWEMYVGITDDLMQMCQEPDSGIRSLMRDIFSPEQLSVLTLRLHPLLKRWTLFQLVRKDNNQRLWQPVCIFHEKPQDGVLPQDLQRSDKLLHHLTGLMGEWRMPDRADFEFIERCDFQKYGWSAVEEFLNTFEESEEREKQRVFEDRMDDFLDYHFWIAMRDAQAHYSQPWSTRVVNLKSDPGRYKIVDMGGWKLRERIYGEQGDLNEMRAAVAGEVWDESASGRAAAKILAKKNERYKQKHGVSLWEAVTGGKEIEWGDKPRAETETKLLMEMVQEFTATAENEERHETIEEWLLRKTREKESVPV